MPEGVSSDPETLSVGYVTKDDDWVCGKCFADFRDKYAWTVVKPD